MSDINDAAERRRKHLEVIGSDNFKDSPYWQLARGPFLAPQWNDGLIHDDTQLLADAYLSQLAERDETNAILVEFQRIMRFGERPNMLDLIELLHRVDAALNITTDAGAK